MVLMLYLNLCIKYYCIKKKFNLVNMAGVIWLSGQYVGVCGNFSVDRAQDIGGRASIDPY